MPNYSSRREGGEMNKRTMLAAIAGALAATTVAGGVAWATIPGDGGVIQGCYTKIGGILRVIDTGTGQACNSKLEVPINWNQKGVKGDPGAKGTDGAPGVSPTVAQVQPGDVNCPVGGAAITDAAGSIAYICAGRNGNDGSDGESFSGTFASHNGEYSISVTDTGITLAHGINTKITLVGNDIKLLTVEQATIRAGTVATVEAGTNFTLKGQGAGRVEAGDVLTLKGSVINQN
jgi:hypothetical protein